MQEEQHESWVNVWRNVVLAYQSFGVVYGDLSTSPLYVYSSTFIGKLDAHHNQEVIFGAFSLVFWTLTLIPLLKYILIVLAADDNGEGGTFALYSLLCRHAKFSLLPNQQPADEQLSSYGYGTQSETTALKRFMEKHKRLRTALLVVVLFGACMVIGDGVLTPAISVLSAVSGLKVTEKNLTNGQLLLIACAILVGLFALQHSGTHRVAFMFAPIVVIWLLTIFVLGIYNTLYWNPKIVYAFSPHYIINFFRETGRQGWISLGGVLLCITGTEAMFADLGHFTASSIRIAFAFVIYPCLVVQYLGQAAFLSKNLGSINNSFFDSVPKAVFWPVFVIATLAAIVGSQAVITATFSIVKQCHALGCFPRIKVVHTSKHIYGQIYIPEINWILMLLTLAITLGFQDTTLIGNAYGLTCMSVMFITTFLMGLVIVFVWQRSVLVAAAFLVVFCSIEGVYLSSALTKVAQGGWVPLVLSVIFVGVMYVWHYGTQRKYKNDVQNKVPLRWILGLGPSLGIVRVPGIGLIYSELATGVPAIFSHLVTNLPAFHQVLVFVCVKSVPVPYVSQEERFLIGRVCPRPYRMYRCIVRYGYKDIQRDDGDFENQLVQSIANFIRMEAPLSSDQGSSSSLDDGRMSVIRSNIDSTTLIEIVTTNNEPSTDINANSIPSSCRSISSVVSMESALVDNNRQRRVVRFQLPDDHEMDANVREELMDLVQAKEAGVAYILGHSYVKARRSSSLFSKLAIDFGYSFLRNNSRAPAVALNIPHTSLIQVGIIYYV
ncbi:potassium transporter 4-like [Rutidosis leptorrhynchoides]|uniref:potassium transporter 4-like n=1 Tax=Rutidosis leptorrhynchoides TaxID=125765 RepID=UPI003A99152B